MSFHSPPMGNRISRWLLSAGVASVVLALGGGCCGGRLVSVQLYESDPQPAAFGCEGNGFSGTSGHFRHHRDTVFADRDAGFRGPAVVSPIPRFHPVPTQPVFEPRVDATPLKLLDSRPTRPGDSTAEPEPTPAKPPQPDQPPA